MNTSNVSGPTSGSWIVGTTNDQITTSNVPQAVEERFALEKTSAPTAPVAPEKEDSVATLHRIRYGGE
jgi:hypothetical protein